MRAAPSTVVRMSCSFRSRNTRAGTHRDTADGPCATTARARRIRPRRRPPGHHASAASTSETIRRDDQQVVRPRDHGDPLPASRTRAAAHPPGRRITSRAGTPGSPRDVHVDEGRPAPSDLHRHARSQQGSDRVLRRRTMPPTPITGTFERPQVRPRAPGAIAVRRRPRPSASAGDESRRRAREPGRSRRVNRRRRRTHAWAVAGEPGQLRRRLRKPARDRPRPRLGQPPGRTNAPRAPRQHDTQTQRTTRLEVQPARHADVLPRLPTTDPTTGTPASSRPGRSSSRNARRPVLEPDGREPTPTGLRHAWCGPSPSTA